MGESMAFLSPKGVLNGCGAVSAGQHCLMEMGSPHIRDVRGVSCSGHKAALNIQRQSGSASPRSAAISFASKARFSSGFREGQVTFILGSQTEAHVEPPDGMAITAEPLL
jgi:hypothetical protein